VKNILFVALVFFTSCITDLDKKHIRIIAPSEETTVLVGDSILIIWETANIENVDLITDQGEIIKERIDTRSIPNFIYHAKNIDAFRFKLLDSDDNSIFDVSDQINIVTPYIKIIEPSRVRFYELGDTIFIKWESCGVEKLEIVTNRGEVLAQKLDASTISEYYYVAEYYGSRFKFKVVDIYNRSIFGLSSEISVVDNKLELIAPNGDEAYTHNESFVISWKYKVFSTNNKIDIFIKYNDEQQWEVIAQNIDSNIGEYKFTNPNKNIGSSCKIKIQETNNSQKYDISDNKFVIYNPLSFDASFFPLKVGNMWNWKRSNGTGYQVRLVNKRGDGSYTAEIKGSNSQISYRYYGINQNGVISGINTTFPIQLSLPNGSYIVVKSTDPEYDKLLTISETTNSSGNKVRQFAFHHWIQGYVYQFEKNIGLVVSWIYGDGTTDDKYEKVIGGIINGEMFGDTTMVK